MYCSFSLFPDERPDSGESDGDELPDVTVGHHFTVEKVYSPDRESNTAASSPVAPPYSPLPPPSSKKVLYKYFDLILQQFSLIGL